MKRKIIIVGAIILIVVASSIIFYRKYTEKHIQTYVNWLSNTSQPNGLAGKVEVERVIKQSPKEIAILAKWGNDEVLIIMEDWLTKYHGSITVHCFDKNKWLRIM
jgi:hypothetical protein